MIGTVIVTVFWIGIAYAIRKSVRALRLAIASQSEAVSATDSD